MNRFQTFLKGGAKILVAAAIVSHLGLSRADAASYTYTLTNYGYTGFITTNCDNCVLNASNITAWSMTVPGVITLASTVPGAQVTAPAGDTDMVATPSGIVFSFNKFSAFVFSNPSGSISYVEALDISSGSTDGSIGLCTPTGCTRLNYLDGQDLIASVAVPFVGAVSYAYTGKVTSATGTYAGAGATVSGTFTFDLDAGDGTLPFSLTTPWSSASTGASRVVSSTLTSGSVTFSDAGSTSNKTTVAGLKTTGSSAPNEYFASDTEFSSATKSVQQSFQIVGGTGANAPFNSNGLPLLHTATGTGTLLATSGNATVGQLTYTITSLTAAPSTLSVSPTSLSFPNTLLNSQSAPSAVSITNTSPNDVSIGGFNFSAGNFQIAANTCASVLRAKANCTVSVVFAPVESPGLDQASFSVADDAQGSPQMVSLAGTATMLPAPAATLSAQSLIFSGQKVGTASAEQPITIKNTGNAPLTFFSFTINGGPNDAQDGSFGAFTLRNNCVPTLAPGKACTVFVKFTAVVPGQVSAQLVISDNVANGEAGIQNNLGQVVGLSGTGTTVPLPGLSLNLTDLDFASQVVGTSSAKQAFDLTNTGTVPLNISSITIPGVEAQDFVLQNACASTLPAGAHCAVFVTYKPVAAGTSLSAVVISSNAGGVVSVPLIGYATSVAAAQVLTLSTLAVDFGSQQDGTTSAMKAVDLTNTGTAPLSLSSIAIVGDIDGNEGSQNYFTLRNDCVPVLQPGKLCALFITFNSMTLKGSVFATLVINNNSQVPQQLVQLSGTGF